MPTIPSYRHHKATGQARVTLDGRDHYLGTFGTPESRARYDRLIAEYLGAGRRVVPVGQSITVAELADQYLRSEDARDGRDKRIVRLVVPLYGDVPVAEFGPLKLRACRSMLIEDDHVRLEVNRLVGRIVRMFRWGVSQEIVAPAIAQALSAVPGLRAGQATEGRRITPVSQEHVWATLTRLAPQVAAAVQAQWWTGMRSGELLSMRPADLDRSARTWVYRPEKHKTAYRGIIRAILIGPRAQAVIEPWAAGAPTLACFRPMIHAKHDHYTVDRYANAIARACRTAGVPHWHPHQLRHAAASRVRAAAGLDAAQVILGHRHAQTTEIYAEADRAKAAEIMARVG